MSLDQDLDAMSVEQLRQEVKRLRGFLRYAISQEGDDLCWRDLYMAAAACLPERPSLENLRSITSKELHLHNCDRFVSSLMGNYPYRADSHGAVLAGLAARVRELTNDCAAAERRYQVQYDLRQFNLELVVALEAVVEPHEYHAAVEAVRNKRAAEHDHRVSQGEAEEAEGPAA